MLGLAVLTAPVSAADPVADSVTINDLEGRGVDWRQMPPPSDQFGGGGAQPWQRSQLCDRPSVPGDDNGLPVLHSGKHVTAAVAKVPHANAPHP